MVKKSILKVSAAFAAIAAIGLIAGCASAAPNGSGDGPIISSLAAEHTGIYPVGNTRVTCDAAAKDGGPLQYQWVSNDGTIIGTGPTITWEAPKSYGDFHIMCTVFDSRGNKTSQTVTVTVLVRDPSTCCR